MFAQTTSLLAMAALATAHFTVEYPEMRGDSFKDGASQWIYPCANVNQTAKTNRTLWPLDGGSIRMDLHHPWAYVYLNLGIGTTYPAFTAQLTNGLLNVTGNGTYCIPKVTVPSGLNITEGTNASIQVVTGGASGSALYNCLDITFSSNATTLPDSECVNSKGVSGSIVTAAGSKNATNTTSAPSTTTTASAASALMSHSIMSTSMFVGLSALAISWLL